MDVLRKVMMLVVVGTLVAGLVSAREQVLNTPVSGKVEVASVEITGRVTYPNGRSPVAQAPVRVWSVAEAKFVYNGVTSQDGTYRLPALEPGRYQLVFADRVRVELLVTEGKAAGAASVDVLIPRGRAVFAQMPIEQKAAILTALSAPAAGDEPAAAEGSGLLKTVVIGGATLTAVGVLADSQDWFEGDRRGVNSP